MKHIAPEESTIYLDPDIVKMEISAMSFWPQRFVLEVRKANKERQLVSTVLCGHIVLGSTNYVVSQ